MSCFVPPFCQFDLTLSQAALANLSSRLFEGKRSIWIPYRSRIWGNK